MVQLLNKTAPTKPTDQNQFQPSRASLVDLEASVVEHIFNVLDINPESTEGRRLVRAVQRGFYATPVSPMKAKLVNRPVGLQGIHKSMSLASPPKLTPIQLLAEPLKVEPLEYSTPSSSPQPAKVSFGGEGVCFSKSIRNNENFGFSSQPSKLEKSQHSEQTSKVTLPLDTKPVFQADTRGNVKVAKIRAPPKQKQKQKQKQKRKVQPANSLQEVLPDTESSAQDSQASKELGPARSRRLRSRDPVNYKLPSLRDKMRRS